MSRRVRGILFVDYVRMIRSAKRVDWSKYLTAADLALADAEIDPQGWYPMETFERYGLGILAEIARGELTAVRMWGRFQLDGVRALNPTLIADADPRESLIRFQVLRRTFFDYDALNVALVEDRNASIDVAYGMGKAAEEAACHQSLGFFERLVEVAGGADVYARFRHASWEGHPATRIDLDWH